VNIGQLQDLARLYNIQLTYEDAAGKRRSASSEALMNVLRTRIGDRDFEDAWTGSVKFARCQGLSKFPADRIETPAAASIPGWKADEDERLATSALAAHVRRGAFGSACMMTGHDADSCWLFPLEARAARFATIRSWGFCGIRWDKVICP